MTEFPIHFEDLTVDAQKRLLKTFATSVECEGWLHTPVTVMYREDDEDEELMEKLLAQQGEFYG